MINNKCPHCGVDFWESDNTIDVYEVYKTPHSLNPEGDYDSCHSRMFEKEIKKECSSCKGLLDLDNEYNVIKGEK